MSKSRIGIPFLSTALLGTSFVVSGIVKLFSIVNFELYVYSFGFASFDLCSIGARMLIAYEILLGLWLISHMTPKLARITTAITLAVFSLFLAWRASVGDTESCHCLGDLVDMSPAESLLKNAGLFALLLLSRHDMLSMRWKWWLAAATAAVIVTMPFFVKPPDIFFRLSGDELHTVADDIAEELPQEGRKIICLYSTECKYCQRSARKISGILTANSIEPSSAEVLFMNLNGLDSLSIGQFYSEYGDGITIPYRIIGTERFLSLTNGEMPIILLSEGGRVVKEYDYLTLDERFITDFLKQ